MLVREINNGIVKAGLFMPDFGKGYYRGVRFDWSGVFSGLTCNGHTYVSQWFPKYDPYMHDAVMGPAEDFIPAGFREAEPGGRFLKIGVGILVRPDQRVYTIRRLYENVNPGKWNFNIDHDRILFIHELIDEDWSYIYEKEVILGENSPGLLLRHSLRNTGKRAIETSVYNHNFFVFDNKPVWPGTEILFPWNVSGEGMGIGEGKFALIGDKKIIFVRRIDDNRTVYCSDLRGYGNKPDDYDFKITNKTAGTGIRVTCDRPLTRLPFWACSATACPEPYIELKALPGKEMSWNIRYEFYDL